MPFELDVRVWSAVLAACRTHKNIEMGEQVSKKIQMLGPESAGNFVFRSNIHSSVGRWDDATHHILETYKGIKMKKLGYQADSGFVLHDVEEEEKGQILLYHSEKIAIAFGILNTNPSKPILVTKNLRCVDCHTAVKFMTLITKREITVRVAS
ncbi:hypothetical protein JHK87_049890 [Glycine soja]|nr:hypothetical protein JHK87_049890 [Glycine soja]